MKLTQGFNIECGIKERCFLCFSDDDWDWWAEKTCELLSSEAKWITNVCKWP